MTKSTIFRRIFGLVVVLLLISCFALAPRPVQAQDPGYPAAYEKFSREELAQMLGPIALYPDKLLSQILMASTYPLEVIEADRWAKRNPGLQGDVIDRALLDKGWDPSVKALCHFPAILALMSERINETTSLGNAFLVQETEVVDMIQELRAQAHARGNLVSTAQQKVIVEKETIIIEPANPRVVYVPYYDPFYIYGPWWYPAYPPYYWGPAGLNLGVRMSFWPGIYFGFSWGTWSYFDWPHRHIYIHAHERPRYVRHDHWPAVPGRWVHAPVHRRGVAYRDKFTATRYGQYPQRAGDFRTETRGFPERRDLERESRRPGSERIRDDRDRHGDATSRYQRGQQEQQRVERDLQQRRQQQVREPADRDRPQRLERREVDRPSRERAEQERQFRQGVDQERRSRPSVEREPSRQNRDNIFEQRQGGRSERQSSERGRFSRQHRSDDSRDRVRPGDAGGRGDQGRSRR